MAEIVIVDKDMGDMLYPSVNEEFEQKLRTTPNDILMHSVGEYRSFPLDFRMRSVVIQSIAKKYICDYPPETETDEERCLIGIFSVEAARKDFACPYMKKAFEALDEEKISEEIIAIHLLGADLSEAVNCQKFVALSRKGIYLRWQTNVIEFFKWEDIVFKPEGIYHLYKLGDAEKLAMYVFDEDFLKFIEEFMILRRTTVLNIGEPHPLLEEAPKYREEYLRFMVDTAAAEGKLSVENLIYLEFLTRSLKISADILLKFLEIAYSGGIKEKTLYREIAKYIESSIDHKKINVFYMDLAELMVDKNGNECRQKLHNILKRDTGLKGKVNIERFVESVRLRKEYERLICDAYQEFSVLDAKECKKDIEAYLRYRNEFAMKLLNIGAMDYE